MPLSARTWLTLAFVVALGVFLRCRQLDRNPMWVDEAESSINALTILQHGVPTHSYLGLPIYENSLTIATPGSAEYEFRDSSYSSTGLATYHAWLPLYAIAASFSVFGIQPDSSGARVQHDAAARRWRTIAGRAPAVVFGCAGLIALFFAGLSLYGRDAAWTALVAGALSVSHIDNDSQARYYSATVLLSVVCCFVVWHALRTREWRHYLWAALPFTLLFHTHLLTFLALSIAFGVMTLLAVRRDRSVVLKLCAFTAIVTAFTLPWMIATGFFQQNASAPRAWLLLTFPRDLWLYPAQKPAYAALFGIGAVALAVLFLTRHRLAPRLREHFRAVKPAVLFLSVLMVAGYGAFLLFIPAASFFFGRLSLSLFGPGILLSGVLISITARCIHERHSEWIAPLMMVLFLASASRLQSPVTNEIASARWRDLDAAISYLDQHPMTPATRVYSSPNDHLTLSFYTGLPVQSIAPVRRDFLSRYPGEILLLERKQPPADVTSALGWPRIQTALHVGEAEARRLSWLLSTHDLRQSLSSGARIVEPPLGPVPDPAVPLLNEYRLEVKLAADQLEEESARLPIFRGFAVRTSTDWWQVFFYRFVDPTSRRGDHANYADRLRSAHATLLPDSTWVAYQSPAPDSRP